jgi:antitoxin (DNA-binding transcriptional repressor) of toxin-antitoxin stability system
METTTMSSKPIDADAAARLFPMLLDEVLSGTSFAIYRDGREVAQLVPTEAPAHDDIPAGSAKAKLRDRIQNR